MALSRKKLEILRRDSTQTDVTDEVCLGLADAANIRFLVAGLSSDGLVDVSISVIHRADLFQVVQ